MTWDQIEVKWAEMVVRVQPNGTERPLPPTPPKSGQTLKTVTADPAKGALA